ncbi:hypothetical protein ABVF61_31020 [Roseibium sp. HPY-6]|uniref:hypothetical protein n=1 Tax=Roseibium sp. HPY-6 TaxID=3229852 RepID=UPI00338DA93A
MIPVMTVSALKTKDLSARLTDISCLNDETGLPRYWATVWASHFGADLQSGTLRKNLSAIDALYRSAERQIGEDCLDRLLFELNVPLIENVASGFFNEERNRSIQYGIDTSQRWNSANRFLFDIMQLGIGVEKDDARVVSAHASLVRLGIQLKNLSPSPKEKKYTCPSGVAVGRDRRTLRRREPGKPAQSVSDRKGTLAEFLYCTRNASSGSENSGGLASTR